MIQFLSKKITDFLAAKVSYSLEDDRYQAMLFFIKAVFHNSIKTVFLLVAAFIISMEVSEDFFAYMIFLICIYGMIKRFSFGVHSSNEILCTITGFIYYFGSVFLAMKIEIHFAVLLMVLGLCLALNWKYAPASTQKRKIGEKENKRFKGYVMSVYMDILMLSAVFKIAALTVFLNLILFAVTWQTITILPITYKILGERRD